MLGQGRFIVSRAQYRQFVVYCILYGHAHQTTNYLQYHLGISHPANFGRGGLVVEGDIALLGNLDF